MADPMDASADPDTPSCTGGKTQATSSGVHWNKVRQMKTVLNLKPNKNVMPKVKPELEPVEINMHTSRY